MQDSGTCSLGVWRDGDETSSARFRYESVVEISRESYDRYLAGAHAYTRLITRRTDQLVLRNYHQLHASQAFYDGIEDVGGEFRKISHNAGFYLMSHAVNWLTSVRLWLESERDRLEVQFGKDSDQVRRFTDAKSLAFDSLPGYRFTYKLRDYAQHCGLPVSSLKVSRADDEGPSRRHISLMMNRYELQSARFDWGRHARVLLEQFEPEFALLPLVVEAMDGIRSIEDQILEMDLEFLIGCLPDLQEALANLGRTEGNPI